MATLIVILCLVSPFLLMWWMVTLQRRVRAQPRTAEEDESDLPPSPAYVEEVRGADGLSYGRRSDASDVLLPPRASEGELDGIKALQGRR